MAAPLARSPMRTYLAMAVVALGVFAALTLLSDPVPREGLAPDSDVATETGAPAPEDAPDFQTSELREPRIVHADPYCNGGRCCPTRLTTFGTTAPFDDVVEAFETQGYSMLPADRDSARPGRWPRVEWTAETLFGGRWDWGRVHVARGPEVDRPDWPTVFSQSSAACGEA